MPRSVHQQRVDNFMRLAGQEVPDKPVLPSLETRRLRAQLIFEEALETIHALGFLVMQDHKLLETCEADLAEIVDGCCDIKVVTTGTLSACGVNDDKVQRLVDLNNLAKFAPGGYRRDDGKWVKPPNHQPPDILGYLLSVGYDQSLGIVDA